MAEAGSGDAGGYVAFISYSHRDAAIGRWLHRKLEGYRLPKRLAGTEGEDGAVPARLTPIFRDRDELPAAGDLSEKVRAALAVSRNLIVVCSPHSAASPWVAREIATFRELHPDRPVLTAIVDGDPLQCFPPSLRERGVEPLAADLRKEGDGRRLGLLKLVAGLAGVGLDSLVQRDAARRIRRVTYITAAAVAAMLAMVLLTLIAFTARAEAERQRGEAEGLVEFMHTDLRERLGDVGRLDIMSPVNERALAFYDRQLRSGNRARDRLMRARILQAIGEDALVRGEQAPATSLFKDTYRTTASLLAQSPNDPDRIFGHAQSEYWLGYLSYLEKDWSRTNARWSSYKRLADRLIALDATKLRSLREAAYAEGNLCTLQLELKEARKAVATCQTALRHMERVHQALPNDRRVTQDLANRQAWLGGAWLAAGRPDQAIAVFQTQERLLAPLVGRFPNDAKLQDQWMRTLMTIAEHLYQIGRRSEAVGYNKRARAVAEKLTAHDPANAAWKKWIKRIDSFPRAVGEA